MALELCLSVQIATSSEVFLIDLNTLSSVVGSQDFARFAEAVFENGDMVKVKKSLMNPSLIAISPECPRLVADWTTIWECCQSPTLLVFTLLWKIGEREDTDVVKISMKYGIPMAPKIEPNVFLIGNLSLTSAPLVLIC